MEEQQIKPEEIKIEIIDQHHKVNIFQSYEPELVGFLREDALENQKQRLSVTFLWFYKENLVSYITLLNDKINLEGDLKDFFHEQGVLYQSLPALKVGRLCVDDRYLRKGLGKLMMSFASETGKEININKAGCRFITVDAKMKSLPFYLKLGFKELQHQKGETIALYLDLLY